jgi:hypothetical protein
MYHEKTLEIVGALIIVSKTRSSRIVTCTLMDLNSRDKKNLSSLGTYQTLESYLANLRGEIRCMVVFSFMDTPSRDHDPELIKKILNFPIHFIVKQKKNTPYNVQLMKTG